MIVDLTTLVTKDMLKETRENLDVAASGHLGTHFDVMNKDFPIEFTERNAIVFDVSEIKNKDIEINDINIDLVKKDMFVAFYSGYIEKVHYGTKEYFKNHPQLSNELIEELLKRQISIIGVDCSGVRRGQEHGVADQKCADNGAFVVENLCNLKELLKDKKSVEFIANTYPIKFQGMSGLPCRVIAKLNNK